MFKDWMIYYMHAYSNWLCQIYKLESKLIDALANLKYTSYDCREILEIMVKSEQC